MSGDTPQWGEETRQMQRDLVEAEYIRTFCDGEGRALGAMTPANLSLLCANLRAALVVMHDNPKLEWPEA